MKKIISIMLVALLLLSFAACNKNGTASEDTEALKETVKVDVEALKSDWQKGELVINDVSVEMPCKVSELIEKTGLKISNQDTLGEKVLKAGETLSLNIVGEDLYFKIMVRNNTKEDGLNYMDATVIKYDFTGSNEGNRQIKLAGTLSPGASRKDVEKALGIPKGKTSEDVLYTYEGKNSQNRKVELNVSFNSFDVANSVSFEIKY